MDYRSSRTARAAHRRALVAPLLALALVCAVAAQARAEGPGDDSGVGNTVIINHSPYISIAANNSDGATAKCGQNHFTAGGFEIKNVSLPFAAHVYQSAPKFGSDRGWRSNAWNPKAAKGAVRLRSFALCLKRVSDKPTTDILYPTESGALTAATSRTLQATCGKGYQVVGGGFTVTGSVIPNQPLTVLGSFPTVEPEGWAVQVLNPPKAPNIEIQVRATCLKTKARNVVVATSPTVLLERHDADNTSVLCPQGSSVVGGGFRIIPSVTTAYPANPLNSNPILRNGRTGWSTVAVNTAPHPFDLLLKTNRVRAFAVCLKG